MKVFLKNNVLPVVAGFIVSSIIMMIFESINHYIYPFPEGMDPMNTESVREFAAILPWQAYILVMLGWIVGSFVGSWTTEKISKTRKYTLSGVLAVLLIAAAFLNYFMLQDNLIFYVISIPIFFATTYLGYIQALKN
jgi:hypothetical protein